MRYLEFILIVAIGLFFFDKLSLWLEEKGVVYYRKQKPSSSGIGNAIQELDQILNPKSQYIIEAKREKNILKKYKQPPWQKKFPIERFKS